MFMKGRSSVKAREKAHHSSATVESVDSTPFLRIIEMPPIMSKEPLFSTEPVPTHSTAYWNNVVYEATTPRKIAANDLGVLLGDAASEAGKTFGPSSSSLNLSTKSAKVPHNAVLIHP